eukprot:239951-Pelagomonas_calceolata.AAC.5
MQVRSPFSQCSTPECQAWGTKSCCPPRSRGAFIAAARGGLPTDEVLAAAGRPSEGKRGKGTKRHRCVETGGVSVGGQTGRH